MFRSNKKKTINRQYLAHYLFDFFCLDIRATILKQFRFVILPGLKVRASGRMKAHIVAEAKLGQIVTIVRKDRNWSLVKYIDRDTQEYVSGWVLTRYIEVFK